MIFSTYNQYAVLVLVLIAGWLFGLASSSGGRRWKERYAAERDAHAAYRRDTDARVAAAEQRHAALERDTESVRRDADTRIAEADRRQAELERERATYLQDAEARRAQTVQPVTDRTAFAPRASSAARPAYGSGERRGWFDWQSSPPRR